jgi:hypothetical protein
LGYKNTPSRSGYCGKENKMTNQKWTEADIDEANDDLNSIGNDAIEMQEISEEIRQLCKSCKTGADIEKRAQELKDLMDDFEMIQSSIQMAIEDLFSNYGSGENEIM